MTVISMMSVCKLLTTTVCVLCIFQTPGHSFKYRFNSETFVVTCDVSNTVQEALSSSKRYKQICSQNKKKEVVLQREKMPKGAVKTDFPCCLIEKDETLDVKFIKLGNSSSEVKKRPMLRSLMHSPEFLVSFNIRTRGDTKIRKLMNNNALSLEVEYVCVFALKGETLKSALKRDGRFKGVFSKKQCALIEPMTNDKTEMLQTVDHLDGKQFEVTVVSDQPSSEPSSQELSPQLATVKNEGEESSDNLNSSQNTPGPSQADDPQKPIQNSKQMKPKTYPNKIQEIPNTGEILQLLRDQFGRLLKELKKRENLTKPAEVRKLFREEYDKSAQSFTEVKRVKELMEFSNSVCQIRVKTDALGTGFLLFDKFILTNAHVIENLLTTQSGMLKDVYAVFDYEDLNSGNKIPVKEKVVAFKRGEVETGGNLDFALLELSETKPSNCLELIHKCVLPPCRGGICIVGHPGGEIKRMDPCFIIPGDQLEMEIEKHLAENSNFIHIITQQAIQDKWKIYESQISYNSCFFHGSSGSPVFDERCNLIGVHTGGYVYKGERTRSVVEFAFPMLPILVEIIKQCRINERSDIVEKLSEPMYFNSISLVFEVVNAEI